MEEVQLVLFVVLFTTKGLGNIHIRTLSLQKSGLKLSRVEWLEEKK